MSISNIQEPNSKDLYCGSFTASGDLTCDTLNSNSVEAGSSLILRPTLDGSGGLAGNAHLSFASNDGVSGVGYISSSASNGEIRFGSNSAGAGIILNATSGSGQLDVQGPVNASNTSSLHGSSSWSGGSSSITVAAVGCTSSHHVHITPTAAGSGGAVLSHVSAGTDEFVVNLSTNDTSNTYAFNWHMMPPSA